MDKIFYIFRHGETDWNQKGRIQGWTDIPLNQNGVAQAKKLAQSLRDVNFDVIYSSPLLRALNTAEIVADNNQCDVVLVDGLRERKFGIFEGKILEPVDIPVDTKIDFNAVPVLVSRELVQNFDYVPENGESHNMFLKRVQETLFDIANNTSAKTIGIATHVGVMRCVINNMDVASVRIPNAGYCKLELDGAKFDLIDIPDWMKKVEH